MNLELLGALNELEKERGISREVLVRAIEDAIQSALRRSAQPSQNLRVDFDERSGRVRVFARKAVVEQVVDPANEISLQEAQRLNPRFEVDDVVEVELTLPDLGRIAAQTAKQVVVQRIREAERSRIYDEFHTREGDILTGVIRRIEHRNVYVDLGRTEGVMPPSEQVATERYAPGVRMKFYLAEVRRTTKGPQVILSRSHPGLLKRLFELEVPEIHDGVVEIKAWAREPGHRSKIAVWSTDRNVDPVGACVGPRGARVQQVVKELRQEKVDVIAWDPDVEVFIANALQPARVLKVYLDPEERTARVIVPEMQLSLAIGKEGQNARLAARLTGWRIDIKSEAQWQEVQREFEDRRLQRAPAEVELPAVADDGADRVPPTELVSADAVAPETEAVAAPVQDEVPDGEEPLPEAMGVPVEQEEQRLRVKAGGKVRRLKGFRRLERRHLEEELEDAQSLPDLFGAEEPAEPAPSADEDAGEPERVAETRPRPEQGSGLSVRLSDLLKVDTGTGAVPAAREPAKTAPSPAEARSAEPPQAPAATRPAAPQRPGPAPAQPARKPEAVEAGQGKGRTEPPSAGALASRRADRPAADPADKTEKKKGKVLKSLAELSLADFGFTAPAGPQRRKGQER